jgi:hypothetical protein
MISGRHSENPVIDERRQMPVITEAVPAEEKKIKGILQRKK